MPSANSTFLWLALVFAAGTVAAQPGSGHVRLLVQSSPLAGFRYHDAAAVWTELKVGDPLELQREPLNEHDASAIGVSWRGRKLGYVPRRANAALASAMDQGERPHARISRLTDHANPARRLELEVFLE
jgi:hypothetical protein